MAQSQTSRTLAFATDQHSSVTLATWIFFFFFVEVFFHPKKHAQVALFFWKKCPWKKTPLLNSMLGKFMVSLKEVYSHDIVYSHVFSVDY